MRAIIDVELKTRKVDFSKCKTDMLAVGLFSDAKELDKPNKELDRKLGGEIGRLIKLGDFDGKDGTVALVYGNGEIGAKRVLLVGLGETNKATLDTVRKGAAKAAKKAVEMKAGTLSLALHNAFGEQFGLPAMGRACAEGTTTNSSLRVKTGVWTRSKSS